MASLAARYAAGEHEAVWREIESARIPLDEAYALPFQTPEDVEDVLHQTFERVARNVDILIERLRARGYLFQSEVEGQAPRRSVGDAIKRIEKGLAEKLAGFRAFEDQRDSGIPLGWRRFAEIVGSVDLRQAHDVEIDGDEVVLANLGDWDPLAVDYDYAAGDLSDPETQLSPMPEGGLALIAEIAPSFEHKANVSGAWNPESYLPNGHIDPLVNAEGIRLPFTTYLRRCFARGGFFGVPRVVRTKYDIRLREVEPSIFLPDHPIFAQLADGLEPF